MGGGDCSSTEGAVLARLRTTSANSPCSLRRSARLTVRCSSALKRIRALAWSGLRDEAVRNRCAEAVDSSAALRSGSPQTSGRWSIPVGWAPDVVSGKSSHSLALARSAGAHGRKGTTYPTSSSSCVCVCLLPRRGAPDPGWLVCAAPLATRCGTKSAPQTSRDKCGLRVLAHGWRHGRPSRNQSLGLTGRRLDGAALLGRAREFKSARYILKLILVIF